MYEDIHRLFGCGATCPGHLFTLQKGTIFQIPCAIAVSCGSKPQLLQCISCGTGLASFWELNQGPSWYRLWSLESYSNNQCISLLKGESHSSLDSADCATRAPHWELRHLAHMQTPALQGHGWISEFDPEFTSVYMLVFNLNLVWNKKPKITTSLILLSK